MLRLKKYQETRLKFMRVIAQEITAVTKDNFVLKGGTALLLGHKLNRFSEDMDFDGKKRIDFRDAIASAAKKCGLECNIIIKKDTETVKRYSVHYGAKIHDTPYPLKIECSFRQKDEINEHDVIKVDALRIYSVQKIIEQKINAFSNRDTARDIYDINFLLKEYPEEFSEEILAKLKDSVTQKGINTILNIYEDEKMTDNILQQTDGVKITLEIEESIQNIMKRHNLQNIMRSATIDDLPKTPDCKTLFNAYVKAVLAETGQVWTDKTNQLIAEKMIKNNISLQRVKNAMKYSPEPIEKINGFIKEIENKPEIKNILAKDRGRSR